jgi:hypothetical protein
MKIRMRDGREFEGTPVEIVRAMKEIAWGVEQMTLSEYIDWVAANAKRVEQVRLDVGGESEEAKAAALVQAMFDKGLAIEM